MAFWLVTLAGLLLGLLLDSEDAAETFFRNVGGGGGVSKYSSFGTKR
jgi:hypothetical protein